MVAKSMESGRLNLLTCFLICRIESLPHRGMIYISAILSSFFNSNGDNFKRADVVSAPIRVTWCPFVGIISL